MSVEAGTPGSVYQRVSQEVERILNNLTHESPDAALQKTNENARQQLEFFRNALDENIESLNRNAEWDRFTIAFYGETNAGKSTVIETLRILLNEESKRASQQAFRNFQQEHQITASDIAKITAVAR